MLWKDSKYYVIRVCVCSLRYPVFNAHAPYYIVISDLSESLQYISTLSHKLYDFIYIYILNMQLVFRASVQLVSEHFTF